MRTKGETSVGGGGQAAELSRRGVLKGAAAAGALGWSVHFPAAFGAEAATIRIGFIAAMSGPGALFGAATDFVKQQVEKAFAGGMAIGGKNYAVEIIVRDSQSSINVAGQAAAELMTRQKVDLLVCSESLGAIAGGQMAVVNQTPIVSTLFPADAMIGIRGGPDAYSNKGKPWTFHFLFNGTDIGSCYVGMWRPFREQLGAKVGTFYVDQPAAKGFADPNIGLPAFLKKENYAITDAGLFKVETDDFSNQVSTFKNAGLKILTGFMFANHFAAFWRAAAQADYKPEIVSIAAAFLFPGGVDALGDRGAGLSTEIWWTPKLPVVSSLTGQTAQALADEWEASQNQQWTPTLGYTHAVWEVAIAALKGSGDPKNREAVRSTLEKLTLDTVVGKVDFANAKVPGIALTALAGGQWRKAKGGKYKYDLVVTFNESSAPFKIEDEFKLLSQLA
jgi:branched-chain amino acid transport system substrate-binding protein